MESLSLNIKQTVVNHIVNGRIDDALTYLTNSSNHFSEKESNNLYLISFRYYSYKANEALGLTSDTYISVQVANAILSFVNNMTNKKSVLKKSIFKCRTFAFPFKKTMIFFAIGSSFS